MRVDLNVDCGEGGAFDAALLELATSANVCAGGHAGSSELTWATIRFCQSKGIAVGIHPGYADREGFGRRSIKVLPDRSVAHREQLWRQIEPFVSEVSYLKPHGAFYHDSMVEGEPFDVLVELLKQSGLPLLGFPDSGHVRAAREAGVRFWSEGFCDRCYRAGTLVPRSEPDALLIDETEIGDQVVRLAGEVDSLCTHGDGPDAVRVLNIVRSRLESAEIEVRACHWKS